MRLLASLLILALPLVFAWSLAEAGAGAPTTIYLPQVGAGGPVGGGPTASPTPPVAQFINGGFEDGLSGWGVYGAVAASTAQAHSGSNSAAVVGELSQSVVAPSCAHGAIVTFWLHPPPYNGTWIAQPVLSVQIANQTAGGQVYQQQFPGPFLSVPWGIVDPVLDDGIPIGGDTVTATRDQADRAYRKYTQEEDAIVTDESIPAREAAKRLGRSYKSVFARRSRLHANEATDGD